LGFREVFLRNVLGMKASNIWLVFTDRNVFCYSHLWLKLDLKGDFSFVFSITNIFLSPFIWFLTATHIVMSWK